MQPSNPTPAEERRFRLGTWIAAPLLFIAAWAFGSIIISLPIAVLDLELPAVLGVLAQVVILGFAFIVTRRMIRRTRSEWRSGAEGTR